jgi:hypothetical protein
MSRELAAVDKVGAVPLGHLNTEFHVMVRLPVPSWLTTKV